MNKDYHLHKLTKEDAVPFDLLLIADETEAAIKKYINESDIYLLYSNENKKPIAVFALYKIDGNTIELKNIGVIPLFRQKGIGSYLIEKIDEIARASNYTKIIVGTPDMAVNEIAFYEKNGFSKYAVKKDFFLQNYDEPVIEDGVMLRDMQMLKKPVR